MASNVTFEDRGTHLRCHYAGPFELRSLLELAHDLRSYCAEHGHRRVLIDLRDSQGTLTTLERYEHAVGMVKEPPLGVRAAVVVRLDQAYADRFWETMTRNRGLVTHVSTDPTEALAWLATDEI
jgi:hypothetical protein